jgi:hypothetical protein
MEIISIKIPRTGSESFGAVLEKVYPASELWNYIRNMKFNPRIYDPNSWYYQDPDPSAPFQKELEEFRPYSDMQYVHNHVPAPMFDGFYDDVPRIAFMREPVSWLLSCYWFAKALGHIPKEMGVWDYIEIDYRKNWMAMMLGGDLSRFDFIGFQEEWWTSVQSFIDRFTRSSTVVLWDNPKWTKNVQTSQEYLQFRDGMLKDKMFIRRCKKLHKDDFLLYKEAYNEFAITS